MNDILSAQDHRIYLDGFYTGKKYPGAFRENPYLVSGPVDSAKIWWRGFNNGRKIWRNLHPEHERS